MVDAHLAPRVDLKRRFFDFSHSRPRSARKNFTPGCVRKMTHRIKYTDETLTDDKSGNNFKRFFADVYNFTLMRDMVDLLQRVNFRLSHVFVFSCSLRFIPFTLFSTRFQFFFLYFHSFAPAAHIFVFPIVLAVPLSASFYGERWSNKTRSLNIWQITFH